MADEIAPDEKIYPSAAAKERRSVNKQYELDFVQYPTSNSDLSFNLALIRDTIWAIEREIADVFRSDVDTARALIRSIFQAGELDETFCVKPIRKKTPDDGELPCSHYNLDVILAVGYRLSTQNATKFRQWATRVLRGHLVDGHCVTAEFARDISAPNKLAIKLQSIRTTETNIYESVRTFFREATGDYDENSEESAEFNDLLQTKFVYAVTSQTPSELLNKRADHIQPNMGLQNFSDAGPTMHDAKISQNYLTRNELYQLHILCEQFLLYVRSMSLRRKVLTMRDLLDKLDELLRVTDYPVFYGYKDFYKDKAVRHAQAEFAMFAIRQKMTKTGW